MGWNNFVKTGPNWINMNFDWHRDFLKSISWTATTSVLWYSCGPNQIGPCVSFGCTAQLSTSDHLIRSHTQTTLQCLSVVWFYRFQSERCKTRAMNERWSRRVYSCTCLRFYIHGCVRVFKDEQVCAAHFNDGGGGARKLRDFHIISKRSLSRCLQVSGRSGDLLWWGGGWVGGWVGKELLFCNNIYGAQTQLARLQRAKIRITTSIIEHFGTILRIYRAKCNRWTFLVKYKKKKI